MRELIFADIALNQYESWLKEGNLKIADRIDRLLENAMQSPYAGLGKPKPLVGSLSGMWSRRISHKDRLVYSATDTQLIVYQCRGHYSDK